MFIVQMVILLFSQLIDVGEVYKSSYNCYHVLCIFGNGNINKQKLTCTLVATHLVIQRFHKYTPNLLKRNVLSLNKILIVS